MSKEWEIGNSTLPAALVSAKMDIENHFLHCKQDNGYITFEVHNGKVERILRLDEDETNQIMFDLAEDDIPF